MKKIFFKKAFSLLELIIASVLVIIVILGIFAINSLLSNSNQDYGQRYFVKSQTQTTLNHILNNASEAIGSGTNVSLTGGSTVPDQGIVKGDDGTEGWGDSTSFCIHQDIPPGPYVSPTTIDNATPNASPSAPPYSSNATRWLCYTWYAVPTSPGAADQIYYCTFPYSTTAPNRGAGRCDTSAAGQVYLGTAFATGVLTNPVTSISFNSTTGFSITLKNCFDNSASSCDGSGDGISSDPVHNPEVKLSGSVFPAQEGMTQN